MSTNMIVISDHNFTDFIDPVVDGEVKLCRSLPRDYAARPLGSLAYAKPFSLPLIPREQWAERLADQKAARATLVDIRDRGMGGQPIPSRNQNGKGYCWAHSTISAMLLRRAADNQPYVDLSAFAVACIIKNYRDQGGWGGDSLEFVAERGVPSSQFWAQQSMSRSNDNAATWANAALHKATEFEELDPEQMEEQVATCLLTNQPGIFDYSWWRHSVGGAAIDTLEGSGTGTRIASGIIWNSWGDGWSQKGMGIIKGRRFIPNSAWCLRVATASAA